MAETLFELKPAPWNPRRISDAQLKRLGRALERLGDLSGIVVNVRTGELVGGHQRSRRLPQDSRIHVTNRYDPPTTAGTVAEGYVEAWGERFAYREVSFSDEDAKLANVAANQHGGEFDWIKLGELTKELDALGDVDMDLLGFEPWQLEALKGGEALYGELVRAPSPGPAAPDPGARLDEAGALLEKWGCQAGDLWIMPSMTATGRAHRMVIGDATKAEDVARAIGDLNPNLMATDPPYGVNLDQSWRDEAGGLEVAPGNPNRVENDDRWDWTDAWKLFLGDVAYVWYGAKRGAKVEETLAAADLIFRQQIIWNKSVAAMGRSAYHWKHESCAYCVRDGKTASWTGDRTQVTVWDAAAPNQIFGGSDDEQTDHPTQKPIELWIIPIRNHTNEGDAVYDPFLGSGTALAAAESLGRVCCGLEISPRYAAVILERMSSMGITPVRESRVADAANS